MQRSQITMAATSVERLRVTVETDVDPTVDAAVEFALSEVDPVADPALWHPGLWVQGSWDARTGTAQALTPPIGAGATLDPGEANPALLWGRVVTASEAPVREIATLRWG